MKFPQDMGGRRDVQIFILRFSDFSFISYDPFKKLNTYNKIVGLLILTCSYKPSITYT